MTSEALERLERLRAGDPAVVRADDLNALVALIRQARLLGGVARSRGGRAFPHPWQVTVRKRDDDVSGLQWRVDVRPGTIADDLPVIYYLRKDDPRGWRPPTGYVEVPAKGASGYSAAWYQRDLMDDPDDPPWLLATAPAANASVSADFTKLARSQWHPYFAFEAHDELRDAELWTAFVILTAAPLRASYLPAIPPPALKQFHLHILPRRPATNFAAQAGGWVQLAQLHLVRFPGDPARDELHVQQYEFWPLWGKIVQPGSDLVNLLTPFEGDPVGGVFASLTLDQLEETLSGTASVEFWTV